MYPKIINALTNTVWAILPEKFEIIMQFMAPRLMGIESQNVDFEAAVYRQT
jgi:hypothetical protein